MSANSVMRASLQTRLWNTPAPRFRVRTRVRLLARNNMPELDSLKLASRLAATGTRRIGALASAA
jgi:hypothetical protein